MIRRLRLPTSDLFHIGPAGLEDISDAELNCRLDALERDPAGTLPDCPLSQLEPLEAV